jgi:YVTN family beta-propeller protein
VIQTSDNTVTATIEVGDSFDVAITPDGTFAYVTLTVSDEVGVIKIPENTVIGTVDVGHFPRGIAITPDGAFAYVTNDGGLAHSGPDDVLVIQTSGNTVTATIEVGHSPFGIALTPAGVFAYVTNAGSDNVSVIRTSDKTVTASFTVGASPVGIAITQLGVGGPFGPGFWKTHMQAWPGAPYYEPEFPAERIFGDAVPDPTLTLLDMLKLRGGGINALGRHATAALLNSVAAFEVFPITTEDLTETFACAVDSGDPRLVEEVKDWFEILNEGRFGREHPPNPVAPKDCPSRTDG